MNTIKIPYRTTLPILAFGGDIKGAFALAKGCNAFLVGGFGDLSELDVFSKYARYIKRYERKLGIKPVIITCDLHPSYYSARYAEDYQLSKAKYQLYRVQHHEAHVASVMADNLVKEQVIGIAFDGTGYGLDGNMWGGEFLLGGPGGFKRPAHFAYVSMPGGDAVVKEPWRMAASHLYRSYGASFKGLEIDIVKKFNKRKLDILIKMIDKNINSPLTSSVGRIFDAAGSIIMAKTSAAFEAQIPIELEELAEKSCRASYGYGVTRDNGVFIIDPKPIIRGIVKDLSRGIDRCIMSAKLHNSIAQIISDVSRLLRDISGVNKVVLSGGVFQNKYLTERALEYLNESGFKVYTHRKVPITDAGIPIGQVVIANSRYVCV